MTVSHRTTELGAYASVSTKASQAAGNPSFGKLDLSASRLYPKDPLTARGSTSNVVAGELSIVSLSANSAVLAFRDNSGTTIFEWLNDAGQ